MQNFLEVELVHVIRPLRLVVRSPVFVVPCCLIVYSLILT
ncbi:hypothetical protein KNP414_06555 [Paenibacillus mucilaginosus KNP414]|uniref:Uncharacterized protein n=1 Tax=Paenibacillus mucilaginosus (strain KNP414) TaxID=1036673 RepID=F8F751_PAEMK|nr:hypothetical protein KNP414_06555 [Paenibacillus mucilaginosus KNP414]